MTVEELEKKIQVLENENRLLKERLSEAGISYADILDETTDGENELYDPDQVELMEIIEMGFGRIICQ